MKRSLCIVLLLCFSCNHYAWNALGHRLIAQIAYDHLTPEAKQICDNLSGRPEDAGINSKFLKSSTWLDDIRRKDIHWFDNLHYIDIPYSRDNTKPPAVSDVNALWGIKQALLVLNSNKSTYFDKKQSLSILVHIVGDIHQPLHTVTRVSEQLPQGDAGGNLFRLAYNPIGKNLHQYWDRGAGILIGSGKTFQVKNKALQLEKKWSCRLANVKTTPQQWVKESHHIALTQVYTIPAGQVPSKKYQLKTQNIAQKQILFAGCRLAYLINKIAKT